MAVGSKPLGEVLVDERLLSREQLQQALIRQKESGQPLGKILLEMGLVEEKSLVEAVSKQIGVAFVDLEDPRLDRAVVDLVPLDFARSREAVPVRIEDNALVVAMAHPSNRSTIQEIEEMTGHQVTPALAVRRHLLIALERIATMPPEQQSYEEEVLQEMVPAGELAAETKEIHIHDLLERAMVENASDIHLTVGTPPVMRIHGKLVRLEEYPILQPAEIRRLVYGILTQKQRETLEEHQELDLSYSLPQKARFRLNVYFQKDAVGAAFRQIPIDVRHIDELGLPPKVADFARLARGFVLVTGPTGSGKSTTLAAIVDVINRERPDHIMTVEDPIEYLHKHKTAIINQREVGTDTKSFANALKHVLRQDPDVILVGEMRDLETISTALTAAETGHLVFATLHTQDAPQTIDRIIDVFPPHQQQQVRVQLAASLQGVVTQQLLPTSNGTGRVLAIEILIATPAVRNLIREGKTHMIYSSMQAGAKFGMQTMDQALADLVKANKITFELALERCHNAEDLAKLAGRA
ncbi:MAG: PilT/PilU family type 4a pilus ATPase [Actinomycetota bacterium]